MKERLETIVAQRDLLRPAGAVAASTVAPESAAAKPVDLKDKRKARYQANFVEVRNLCRVNSYPLRQRRRPC